MGDIKVWQTLPPKGNGYVVLDPGKDCFVVSPQAEKDGTSAGVSRAHHLRYRDYERDSAGNPVGMRILDNHTPEYYQDPSFRALPDQQGTAKEVAERIFAEMQAQHHS